MKEPRNQPHAGGLFESFSGLVGISGAVPEAERRRAHADGSAIRAAQWRVQEDAHLGAAGYGDVGALEKANSHLLRDSREVTEEFVKRIAGLEVQRQRRRS